MGLYYRTIVNANYKIWFKPKSEFIDCELLCEINNSSVLKTIEIKQDEIFEELYQLGKEMYDISVGTSNPISIENWNSIKNIVYENERYGAQFALSKTFFHYIDNVLIDKEHSDKIIIMLKDIISKYGIIITTIEFEELKSSFKKDNNIHGYKYNLKRIIFNALLIYILKRMLDSIKSGADLNFKLIYVGISNKNAFGFIKDIIKQYFYLNVIIEFDDEINYIAENYCIAAGLKLYAITKEMGYDIEKEKPNTYPCIKCGFLFVRLGREKICPKCKEKDVNIRQKRCREKRKKKKM